MIYKTELCDFVMYRLIQRSLLLVLGDSCGIG